MNNIVAAILLITITTAGAAALYHYRDSLATENTQPLSLERIGPYNQSYDLFYVSSGCLSDVLAYDSLTGGFQKVQKACTGSLVLLPRPSSP